MHNFKVLCYFQEKNLIHVLSILRDFMRLTTKESKYNNLVTYCELRELFSEINPIKIGKVLKKMMLTFFLYNIGSYQIATSFVYIASLHLIQ